MSLAKMVLRHYFNIIPLASSRLSRSFTLYIFFSWLGFTPLLCNRITETGQISSYLDFSCSREAIGNVGNSFHMYNYFSGSMQRLNGQQ